MQRTVGPVAITGSSGFLGKWVLHELVGRGLPRESLRLGSSREFDLRDPDACRNFVRGSKVVIHLAARVGGIGYHVGRASQMFVENLMMGINVLRAAKEEGVEYVLISGTACSYPDEVEVPLLESDLWSGRPTGETAPYGMAKRTLQYAGETFSESGDLKVGFVIPTNLYGPEDHFDTQTSHVIPALIARFEKIRLAGGHVLDVWGDGSATRDFLYVADAASGIVDAVEARLVKPINLGSGEEVTIARLAREIANAVFAGGAFQLSFDKAKPVGARRRALDYSTANDLLHWSPSVTLSEGLSATVDWYRTNRPHLT